MLALTATAARADDAAEIADLRERLRQLETRLGASTPDPDARNALGDLDQRLLMRGIYQVLALEAGYVTEGCREAVAALQARLFVPLEQVVPPLG